MVKNIGGGSTGGSSGGSSSSTNNYATLIAASFINTGTMTSPSANITSLTSPTLNSTTATVTSLSAGVLTNTTSLTSPSAEISTLTAPMLSTSYVTSDDITNSRTISTASLTATGAGITTTNCTISGTLSMNGTLDLTNIASTTITVGTAVTTFPINVSEFDATTIIPDPLNNSIGSSIADKRTAFSAIQVGVDLSVSIDDNGAVAAGLLNGVNGAAAIDFPFSQTSYLDADTNSIASSSTEMTIVAAFQMLDIENTQSIVSYNNAQPSINIAVGGNLWIERTGKYNLDTGITLAVGTNYILVITLSATGGIKVRVNGVLQYTNTTSYGSYFFNTDLAFIGRHWIIDTQFFIGRLGDIMTAASLLSDSEIANIESYLSAKFQIGIGSSATISAGDPFSTGSGSIIVYGALDTTGVTTDTLAVSSTATFTAGATVSAGTLTVTDTITTQNLSTNVFTTTGIYYEGTAAAIQTATANIYNLVYTNAGIFYISGADYPTTNFSVLIQNIPTDTTKIYTLSLVYYQSSAAFYCNAVAVTDSDASYILGTASTYETPKFSGGTPTFTSTSPNLVIQQFSIISIPDTVGVMTRHVVSSVSPFS